ncbi:tetratricopeptide repeat protein [Hylemonella sp. W303a]|uniref:tetratricopeptide repeat protein n=1 Tax=Hylemonella sp. W303a TaxID=3389873 RepID=UPI00396B2C60
MMKLTAALCLCLAATMSQAQDDNKPDCRHQVVDKNIVSLCHRPAGLFQHYHFSLSLNDQLIFVLVDDYVEKVELEHIIPEGPALEFPLSKQPGLKRVKISGGCVPISEQKTEVGRKCDFSWGKLQAIRNVWFDFPDKNDPIYQQCMAGQAAVSNGKHADSLPLLEACVKGSAKNDQQRRQAFIYRAWAHYSLENFPAALKDQQAAFAISPAQGYGDLVNMALYLREMKQYQEALTTLAQAEVFDKQARRISMNTQYPIGWNLQLMGRNEEAVKVLTDAIPAQPNFPFTYYLRGLAYEGLANREAAKADFEKFKELLDAFQGTNMSSRLVQAAIKKLQEYGIPVNEAKN